MYSRRLQCSHLWIEIHIRSKVVKNKPVDNLLTYILICLFLLRMLFTFKTN